jgi:glutamate dehydrogenase/leucine dehydrogenase
MRVTAAPSDPGVFEQIAADGYEQVVFCHDSESGLRSIIVIHNTTLGPALGGVRMWPYASESDALRDCLRLAKGMTYKAAIAGVNLGGGKSVIIGDPRTDKTEALLRSHGRFIETLGGRYIPGIDIGTEMADLDVIATEARVVSCVRGDPSPMTALGVFEGMQACLRETCGVAKIDGKTVAVQGLGHVGAALAELVAAGGGKLVVADLDDERANSVARRLGAVVRPAGEILFAECDVLAPCAMGAVFDDETIPLLECKVIAGSANNVLQHVTHGDALHERGILYAPDYCVNAGGLIFLEEEILAHNAERTKRRVEAVGNLIARVIERARQEGISTAAAADVLARERLEERQRPVAPAYVGGRR